MQNINKDWFFFYSLWKFKNLMGVYLSMSHEAQDSAKNKTHWFVHIYRRLLCYFVQLFLSLWHLRIPTDCMYESSPSNLQYTQRYQSLVYWWRQNSTNATSEDQIISQYVLSQIMVCVVGYSVSKYFEIS
jgi:hypothetical protein